MSKLRLLPPSLLKALSRKDVLETQRRHWKWVRGCRGNGPRPRKQYQDVHISMSQNFVDRAKPKRKAA